MNKHPKCRCVPIPYTIPFTSSEARKEFFKNILGLMLFVLIMGVFLGVCATPATPQDRIPNQPPRFWVCLVHANPETGGDMSTIMNGDQWEWYQERYPGSYRGCCSGDVMRSGGCVPKEKS